MKPPDRSFSASTGRLHIPVIGGKEAEPIGVRVYCLGASVCRVEGCEWNFQVLTFLYNRKDKVPPVRTVDIV